MLDKSCLEISDGLKGHLLIICTGFWIIFYKEHFIYPIENKIVRNPDGIQHRYSGWAWYYSPKSGEKLSVYVCSW
jgi:hypothetical protein